MQKKYEKEVDSAHKVTELLSKSDEELREYIAKSNTKKGIPSIETAVNILEVRNVISELEKCINLANESQLVQAYDNLKRCKLEISRITGLGKDLIKPKLLEIAKSIEKNLEHNHGVNSKCQTATCSAIELKAQKEVNLQSRSTANDTNVDETPVLLSIISRIENIIKAYEADDFDTCINEYRTANQLLSGISTNNENAKAVAKELRKWQQTIQCLM
jgi:hypothetical protein